MLILNFSSIFKCSSLDDFGDVAVKVRMKNSPAHRLKVYSFDGDFMEGTRFKSQPLTKYIKLSSGYQKYCVWKDMLSVLYLHVNNDM